MIHRLVFVCFAFLILGSFAQKEVGDSCIEEHTQTEGHCALLDHCISAWQDFQKYKIRPTQCGFSENSLLVCCRDPLPSTTTRPSTTSKSTPRKPGDISNKKCEEYGKFVTQTVSGVSLSLEPVTQKYSGLKCKYRGTELIVGGVKATQGEFPHMAAIGWKKTDGEYSFECGGTLIDKRFVLTAGHCTRLSGAPNESPEVVRLGDQNLDSDVYDEANPVQIGIRKIYKHPNYKYTKQYNDIALLELENDVQFNDDIRPACLWTNETFGNITKVLAIGWGIVDSATNEKSNELLKVSLSILDIEECNNTLVDIINRRWSHGFDETQMCAGDKRETKDTCQGDSGSPLQIISDSNKCLYQVLGIVSFGAKFCGTSPAVYTKVSSYVEWIENIVWPSK